MNRYQSKKKNDKKTLFIVIAFIIILFINLTNSMASDSNCITPTDQQYIELRAVEIKEKEGKNKQVIMELWGNNIEFKRI